MNRRLIAIILLLPFTLLSIYAVIEVGYFGIFEQAFANPGGWQLFADLAISLLLVFSWLIPEARKQGRNPWPWFVATLFVGSFAPLIYLALHGAEKSSESR